MSDIYGHDEDYRELLAYQLVRQFNTTSPATYNEVELILQDMSCPPECEVWVSKVDTKEDDNYPRTLYWYCGPVLVRYRGKTWLISDKFYPNKDDMDYFSDTADAHISSESFQTAFPGARDLVQDWVPF